MKNQTSDFNIFFAHLIIDEIVRNQASLFCLSPGHRSAPLAAALAKNKQARYRIFIDERSSGYFAVGHLKANPKKNFAVLLCTSGSAVMNYYPAIVEAHYSHLPLLIVSADRPPELRETGANQTADQIKLFGKYTHFFVDLPCPSNDYSPNYLLSTIDYCMWQARFYQGPVHINCMFREPFLSDCDFDETLLKYQDDLPPGWLETARPYCVYEQPVYAPSDKTISNIVEIIRKTSRGIILVGDSFYDFQTKQSLCRLFDIMQWPVFPDSLVGGFTPPVSIFSMNMILPDLLNISAELVDVETILIIGERFVSKKIDNFLFSLQHSNRKEIIRVSEYSSKSDSLHMNSYHIYSHIHIFVEKLLQGLKNHKSSVNEQVSSFFNTVKKLITEQNDRSEPPLCQASISARQVARMIGDKMNSTFCLFLANSTSVRLMDEIHSLKKNHFFIAGNRGVSGIDGNIASAAGFSEANQKPGILLIGDLAFLHDLNSLNLIEKNSQPMIILLLNDNGGGLFSRLDIAQYKGYRDVFEKVFITPQNLTFEASAHQFGLNYFSVSKYQQLEEAYLQAVDKIKSGKSSLIEIILTS